jgi:hypothetical protein
MHPQLMQLLDLKHNLTTQMHCARAVQLNLEHSLTTQMHCASAVHLNLKQSYCKNALRKCSASKCETQYYYTNALYKCSAPKFETHPACRDKLSQNVDWSVVTKVTPSQPQVLALPILFRDRSWHHQFGFAHRAVVAQCGNFPNVVFSFECPSESWIQKPKFPG